MTSAFSNFADNARSCCIGAAFTLFSGAMPRLRKRSILLAGHATSMALEPEFWAVLEDMAQAKGASLAALIAELDQARGDRPLASACRVAALAFSRG